jgi:hypothetical protein
MANKRGAGKAPEIRQALSAFLRETEKLPRSAWRNACKDINASAFDRGIFLSILLPLWLAASFLVLSGISFLCLNRIYQGEQERSIYNPVEVLKL